jgi:hypothetical protein
MMDWTLSIKKMEIVVRTEERGDDGLANNRICCRNDFQNDFLGPVK